MPDVTRCRRDHEGNWHVVDLRRKPLHHQPVFDDDRLADWIIDGIDGSSADGAAVSTRLRGLTEAAAHQHARELAPRGYALIEHPRPK